MYHLNLQVSIKIFISIKYFHADSPIELLSVIYHFHHDYLRHIQSRTILWIFAKATISILNLSAIV